MWKGTDDKDTEKQLETKKLPRKLKNKLMVMMLTWVADKPDEAKKVAEHDEENEEPLGRKGSSRCKGERVESVRTSWKFPCFLELR